MKDEGRHAQRITLILARGTSGGRYRRGISFAGWKSVGLYSCQLERAFLELGMISQLMCKSLSLLRTVIFGCFGV